MPSVAVFYALASSLFYSASVVVLRPLFADKTNPEAASFYTLLVAIAATGLWLIEMFLISMPETVNIEAIAFFVLSGILGAGIARIANYHAVKILGATRGNLLVNSSPLFVLPLAALFLGEAITTSKLGGAALIFTAIVILSIEGRFSKAQLGSYTKRGVLFGLLAAILYTFARISRKAGTDYAVAPVSAAFVSSVTAFFMVSSATLLSSNFRDRIRVPKSVTKILLLAGLLQAAAQILEFVSYGAGDASLVVPVRGATPLITAGLSYLFIRKYESMTMYLIFAIIIGTVGIIILSYGA